MKVIDLYRYEHADGSVTVSPVQPAGPYTQALRLVAEEGKLLTMDGERFFPCVDTDTAEGWQEVDAPEATAGDYRAALTELGVDIHEEN